MKNVVSETGNSINLLFRIRLTKAESDILNHKFKEKAGETEWIIAILMGEVAAQDMNYKEYMSIAVVLFCCSHIFSEFSI